MVTMRIRRDVHCKLPQALGAMDIFSVLYSQSGLTALGHTGTEFICEPLPSDCGRGTHPREVFFVHWPRSPGFHIRTLHGIVYAAPNGLTTTLTLEAIYLPEIGLIGAIFDRCIGTRFARGAIRAFFERLLRFVQNEAGLDHLLRSLLTDETHHRPS